MLYYAFVFFVIALICGLLGFGFIVSAFATIAKILFYIFVFVFLVSLYMEWLSKRSK